MRTRIASSLLILCAAAVPQTRAQTTPESTTPAVPTPVTVEQPKAAVSRAKDTLSVDFPDEEIRTVLRNVADLFELNLVIPDTLQGKTSVKLRDVTWRQIFKVVLEPANYTFVEDGNIIKVVTLESLNLEPLSTEVFVLNYARASEVKPSLDALVDAKLGGKIVVDARSNALVVSERPSAIQRIRPIVQNLDKATEQVMIETKFIEVTDRDVKNIGVNWSSLSGYKMSAGAFHRNYEGSSGRLSSNGVTQDNLNVAADAQGRAQAYQVTGAVLGPKTTTTVTNYPAGSSVGTPVLDANGNITGREQVTTTYPDIGWGSTSAQNFFNNITRSTTAVFDADQFSVILSALKTLNNTKLVSNPTVVTLNNNEASINIGEEFPVPNYTYNQERGSFEVSGFAYKPIGVILKVTPQVNSAGFIKLAVEPEVSSRNGVVNFGGAGGAEIPIIGVRKTKTQVTLKDGFTLGIGGLVESTTIKDESKVPLLGSIPGLGRLFRSDSNDKTNRNLVVFITARTVKADGASVGEVFDPRTIRAMNITKDELPGFRDGSDPFYQAPMAAPSKK